MTLLPAIAWKECSLEHAGLVTSSEHRNCAGNFYSPSNLLLAHPHASPSQDRCDITHTTLQFLTQQVQLDTSNTILIRVLMKTQNNLPVTEALSPPRKIKVAKHPTHGLFFLCLHFIPSACPQASLFWCVSSCRAVSADPIWLLTPPFAVLLLWDVHWAGKQKNWIGVQCPLYFSLQKKLAFYESRSGQAARTLLHVLHSKGDPPPVALAAAGSEMPPKWSWYGIGVRKLFL